MSLFANFFHEVGMLAHTPRSGFAFLGTGAQSVVARQHAGAPSTVRVLTCEPSIPFAR
jgi:hypothetical protein